VLVRLEETRKGEGEETRDASMMEDQDEGRVESGSGQDEDGGKRKEERWKGWEQASSSDLGQGQGQSQSRHRRRPADGRRPGGALSTARQEGTAS
jgi:hypothetical protein